MMTNIPSLWYDSNGNSSDFEWDQWFYFRLLAMQKYNLFTVDWVWNRAARVVKARAHEDR